MKPLNRPMFKYGGPIKEGIMSGMKDNRQAINTVGSPLAPTDSSGRQGYAVPLILGTIGRALLRPLGKFAARTIGTGSGKLKKYGGYSEYGMPTYTTQNVVKQGATLPKGTFQPNPLGAYLMRSPEGRFIMGTAGFAGKAGSKAKGVVKGLASSPLTLGSAGIYGSKAIYDKLTKEKTPEAQAEIEAAGGPPGGGDPEMFLTPRTKEDPNKTDELTKDRIQKTKERYYKLMGLDKMKKDSVYDSLIDASKIIQQEGGDLKGSIKSGSLQTQIIDAISKNLDKSAGIKRQIDAAVLKGEIEKDINKEKNQLDAEYKKAAIEKMKAADGTLLSDIRGFIDKFQTLPSGTALAGLAKTRGLNVVKIADTQEVTDWISKNGGDEEDFIKSIIQDPENEVAPGIHVVKNALIEVGADGSVTKLF